MKKPLKKAIQQHYKSMQLSDEQWTQLNQIQLKTETSPETSPETKRNETKKWFIWGGAAAAIFLAAFQILQFTQLAPFSPSPAADIRQQVIQEIAYNHNQRLESEISTASLPRIHNYLTRLNFSLIDSKLLPSEQWILLGGRYCSIQKQLAAQLHLTNSATQKRYTWYQLPMPGSFLLNEPYTVYHDGVKVKIWQEKGILNGLAGVE